MQVILPEYARTTARCYLWLDALSYVDHSSLMHRTNPTQEGTVFRPDARTPLRAFSHSGVLYVERHSSLHTRLVLRASLTQSRLAWRQSLRQLRPLRPLGHFLRQSRLAWRQSRLSSRFSWRQTRLQRRRALHSLSDRKRPRPKRTAFWVQSFFSLVHWSVGGSALAAESVTARARERAKIVFISRW